MTRSRRGTGTPRRRRAIVLTAAVCVVACAGAVLWARRRADPFAAAVALRRDAAAALSGGRLDEARAFLERLVVLAPTTAGFRSDLARCRLALGDAEGAERDARAALAIDAAHAPAHAVLSAVLRSRGDLDGAVDEARRAARGNDVAPGATLALVARLADAGLDTEAELAFRDLPERDAAAAATDPTLVVAAARLAPDSDAGRAARARLRVQRGALERALSVSPAEPRALECFVRACLVLDDPKAALAALTAATRVRSATPVEAVLWARALAADGDREGARKLLASAVTWPDAAGETPRVPLLVDAAVAAIDLGATDDASRWIDEILRADPANVAALRLRLAALRRPGAGGAQGAAAADVESAATAVLGVRPHDESALRARIQARISAGRSAEAFADVLAYRRLAPDAPDGAWAHGICLVQDGRCRSALPLLQAGRDAAASPRVASEWIVRAAVAVRDTGALAAEVAVLDAPDLSALVVAADAVLARWDDAERRVGSPDFAACDAADRVLAALECARGGRRALSEAALAGIDASGLPERVAAMAAEASALMASAGGAADPQPAADAAERDAPRPAGLAPELAARLAEARRLLAKGDDASAAAAAREVLARSPGLPDALAIVLEALYRSKAPYPEMEQAADALLEVDPSNRRARSVRAHGVWQRFHEAVAREDAAGANEAISDVIRLTPGDSQARIWHAAMQGHRGDHEAAEEDLRILEDDPAMQQEARLLRGALRYVAGRYEEAAAAFRAALRGVRTHRAEAHSGLVLSLLAAGDVAAALEAADEFARSEPGNVRAVEFRSLALASLGRVDEAATALRAAFSGDPSDTPERVLLGRILLGAGRCADAAAVFREVIAAFPDDPTGYSWTVTALVRGARYDEADGVVAAAAARPSLAATALLLRAAVARGRGSAHDEMAALRAAVAAAPDRATYHVALGARLLRDGALEEAARHVETARALDPRDHRPWLLLGTIAEREKRPRDALDLYRGALRIAPHDPVACNNVAQMLIAEGGRPDEALRLARDAVVRGPKVAEFRDTLAQALAASRKTEEAIAAADEVLRLAPDRADLALSAARLFVRLGDPARARRAAEAAQRGSAPRDDAEVKAAAARIVERLAR